MAWIDQRLEDVIRKQFPEREVLSEHAYRSWQQNRYLFVTTALVHDRNIHYEYTGGGNKLELHLEGKYQTEDYRWFRQELKRRSHHMANLTWTSLWGHINCRCVMPCACGTDADLEASFRKMMELFDPIISDISQMRQEQGQATEAYKGETKLKEDGLEEDSVSLETCCLGQLFGNKLVIPDYQRNYCWEEKQVKTLWQSLHDVPENGDYHLGTIILQKDCEGNYAIIDGQQRLVTLTLICKELGYEGPMPLLSQTFRSEASRKRIAENKFFVRQYCKRNHDNKLCRKTVNNLKFSVLVLTDSRLELAYTFFSNENSKGVPLSDFDLLKAHHLRFISSEQQAEHLAGRWNQLTACHRADLEVTLSTHLFRLRRWMRGRDFYENERLRTKEEYSAAELIPEIPPFGEQFCFYEKIQGGTHFFAYVQHFVDLYAQFQLTPEVQALRNHLSGRSHWRYASVIETLLFGYFLKFGRDYLAEALFCIAGYMAQHRYQNSHARAYKIRQFAKDSEIVMMADQASSPTFFLAECLNATKVSGRDFDLTGIAEDFNVCLSNLFSELEQEFTVRTIIEKIQ